MGLGVVVIYVGCLMYALPPPAVSGHWTDSASFYPRRLIYGERLVSISSYLGDGSPASLGTRHRVLPRVVGSIWASEENIDKNSHSGRATREWVGHHHQELDRLNGTARTYS